MHPDRRELIFKVLLAGVIFMLAGPEILPAIEMTTLLELLGVTLFLTAFGSALRLLAREVAEAVINLFLPPALAVMYRQTTRPLEKGGIAGYLLLRALYIALLSVVVIVFIATHVA